MISTAPTTSAMAMGHVEPGRLATRGSREAVEEAAAGWTVTAAFAEQVRARTDQVALRVREGDRWRETTWREYGEQACRFAAALAEFGLAQGERVALLLRNCPEFHVADVGVLLAGGTPVSLYTSSSADQFAYLLGHAGARIVVVDDDEVLQRLQSTSPGLTVIAVGPNVTVTPDRLDFSQLIAEGRRAISLQEAAAAVEPSALATIIYTSGTTGAPKGVMLDHRNVAGMTMQPAELVPFALTGIRVLSYLPMAHIGERTVSHYGAIAYGQQVTSVPDIAKLGEHLRLVSPELFFGVPRVWEKLQAGVLAVVAGDKGLSAALDEALRLAAQEHAGGLSDDQQRRQVELAEAVCTPLRQAIGLADCKLAITGAAPMPLDTLLWFRAIGVPMSEIWGMSETTGGATWDPVEVRPGTVGRPLPGSEVKVLVDGELCWRGLGAFRGYLNDPDKTAETVDADGWIHTGDIGQIDADGYVSIVDRKKEILITAGGKNVAPAPIEGLLRAHPLIGQAVVIGDARPYLTALITLDHDVLPGWAAQHGLSPDDLEDPATAAAIRSELMSHVDSVNGKHGRAESIKDIRVLAEEWQPDSDLLTPTMKLKRRMVYERYGAAIEAMYGNQSRGRA